MGGKDDAQRHGPPGFAGKLKDTLLAKVGGNPVSRKLHAPALQGQQPRDIVLAGQYAQVYAVVVLQGLTNAYGLVVARRAQVIGTPRHSAGKIGLKVRFNLGHLGVLGRLSRYCQKNHGI